MDSASLIGILLGAAAIIGGNLLEGGTIGSISQSTAAVIVFGGTFGATLLSYPLSDIIKAARSLRDVFFGKRPDYDTIIEDIVRFSNKSRRRGIISLENETPKSKDIFLMKALRLTVDGMSPASLRETMEQDISTYEEEKRRIARVFDTAGGFAPTIGILGAVLGLIHVMENLQDPAKLGTGIAVAFVATIYGVGSANIMLLPISKKLQNNLHSEINAKEMIIEGVLGIQAGINPRYLEERLRAFVEGQHAGAA